MKPIIEMAKNYTRPTITTTLPLHLAPQNIRYLSLRKAKESRDISQYILDDRDKKLLKNLGFNPAVFVPVLVTRLCYYSLTQNDNNLSFRLKLADFDDDNRDDGIDQAVLDEYKLALNYDIMPYPTIID